MTQQEWEYVFQDIEFYAAPDIAKKYGKTRQWWWELMRDKKLQSKRTRAGMITTNIWVDDYLKNKK